MERREFIAILASTPVASVAAAGSDDQQAKPAAAPKPLGITMLGTGTPSPATDRSATPALQRTEPSPAYRMACGNHKDNALIAKRAGVKTLVLTHLLGQIDQPGVREQIVHEIMDVFDGEVIWGEDLMRLTLANARVSTIESRQD